MTASVHGDTPPQQRSRSTLSGPSRDATRRCRGISSGRRSRAASATYARYARLDPTATSPSVGSSSPVQVAAWRGERGLAGARASARATVVASASAVRGVDRRPDESNRPGAMLALAGWSRTPMWSIVVFAGSQVWFGARRRSPSASTGVPSTSLARWSTAEHKRAAPARSARSMNAAKSTSPLRTTVSTSIRARSVRAPSSPGVDAEMQQRVDGVQREDVGRVDDEGFSPLEQFVCAEHEVAPIPAEGDEVPVEVDHRGFVAERDLGHLVRREALPVRGQRFESGARQRSTTLAKSPGRTSTSMSLNSRPDGIAVPPAGESEALHQQERAIGKRLAKHSHGPLCVEPFRLCGVARRPRVAPACAGRARRCVGIGDTATTRRGGTRRVRRVAPGRLPGRVSGDARSRSSDSPLTRAAVGRGVSPIRVRLPSRRT